MLRSGALWIWMPRSVIACETFYFCRDIQILFGPSIHIWYLMKCEKLRNKVMNLKWSKGSRYFFWLCPSRTWVDRSKSKSQPLHPPSRLLQGCIHIQHNPRCPVLLSNTGKYTYVFWIYGQGWIFFSHKLQLVWSNFAVKFFLISRERTDFSDWRFQIPTRDPDVRFIQINHVNIKHESCITWIFSY